MDESNLEESQGSSPLIINLILQALQKNPHRISLEFNQLALTNQQLLQKVIELANKFSKVGISENMRVCMLLERSPEALVCLFALWRLGAIYIPLDPEHPQERIEYVCDDAEPNFIITQHSLSRKLKRLTKTPRIIALQNIDFEQVNELPKIENLTNSTYSSQTLAYILYTSGSTGQAKGVEISHYNLTKLFQGVIPLLSLSSNDHFIGLTNFSFDIAFFELLAPFLVGGRLTLLSAEQCHDPQVISSTIETKNISVIQATPSLWSLINQFSWNIKKSKIIAISTGEALPPALAKNILKHCSTLWNLYGPTECTIWASAKKLILETDINDSRPYISIGSALPDYSLNIVNNELCIGGCGLARGYRNNETLSLEKFKNNTDNSRIYSTGDVVSKDEIGEFHFQGRIDNQVKLNGYRIELEEIENALEVHPSIKQAIVQVQPASNDISSLLFAFIAYEKGMPNKTIDSLNTFLAKSLPLYMLPQRYYFLEDIALTPNGKKDRKVLAKHRQVSFSQHAPSSAENSIEKIIASFFCNILELKEIGRFDSFFDAGGNSMLAASLTMAINNHFETEIALKDILLTPPTVHNTASLVQVTQAA